MSRDSNGNYSLPAGNPVTSGDTIASSWANNTLADVATELTNSLDRTGKGGMTGQFKFTDGTVGAPGASFTNETASGLYRAGAGDFRFSINGGDVLRVQAANLSFWSGAAWRTVWHANNDGAGSGLDADLLDTYEAAAFPRKAENAVIPGNWDFTGDFDFLGPGTFRNSSGYAELGEVGGAGYAGQYWIDYAAPANAKWWGWEMENTSHNGSIYLTTVNDSGPYTYKHALEFQRSGNSLTSSIYGNATDNPSHIFHGYPSFYAPGMDIVSTAGWGIYLQDQSAPVDEEWWAWESIGGTGDIRLFAANDAYSIQRDAFKVTRGTGPAIANVAFGNASDNPTFSFLGTGAISGNGSGLTGLNGSNIASGTVAPARLGSGTPGSGNFLRGDGTWATTPVAGALDDVGDVTITAIASGEILKWNGSAWINNTLAEAGIAAATHVHAASDITSGTMATARLGSGTANSSTFLRGDQTWAAPPDYAPVIRKNTTTTVSGTVSETSVLSGTINANTFTGKVLRFKIGGRYSNASGTGGVTVRVKYGATTILSKSFTVGAATDAFNVEGLIADSGSNTQAGFMTGQLCGYDQGADQGNQGTGAEATTSSKTFEITLQPSNSAYTFDVYAALVEIL